MEKNIIENLANKLKKEYNVPYNVVIEYWNKNTNMEIDYDENELCDCCGVDNTINESILEVYKLINLIDNSNLKNQLNLKLNKIFFK